jgi:hemolysin activation/secretion protein
MRVLVREFRFSGNTAFDDATLAAVLADYTGRTLSTEELILARDAVTRHYIAEGYVNSGAVLPDQTVEDGVIELEIVEGRLGEVVVEGLESLDPSFVEDRLRLSAGVPLDVDLLRERIQLLLGDPAIQRINARLGPSREPGVSRLELEVLETPRYRSDLRLSNDRSPAIGAEGGELAVTFGNLLGRSDPLRLELEVSEGLRDFTAGYSVPLTARDLRLFVTGEISDADVVTSPGKELDVESRFAALEVGLEMPVYRTLDQELRLGASVEREHTATYLLGRSFDFSPGADDGETDVTALRFNQLWQHRSSDQVVAVRSTFSFGLPVLGATENSGNIPDGEFFAWLGQAQYARRLDFYDWRVRLRGDLQLTPDPLLPVEQIAIGGLNTVRGYRKNQLVVDNGWVASAELHIPLAQIEIPRVAQDPNDGVLQLRPFFDAGGGWNNETPDPDPDELYGIGAGLYWQLNQRLAARLDYALPLKNIDTPDNNDLQDIAIYFELTAALY